MLNREHRQWAQELVSVCPPGTIRTWAKEFFSDKRLRTCRAITRPRFVEWVRKQASREPRYEGLLEYLLERLLPLPVEKRAQGDDSYSVTINGDVALVEIEDGDRRAILKIPTKHLPWLRAFGRRIHLRELPRLESPVAKEIRLLEKRLARDGWKMTQEQKFSVIDQVNALEINRATESEPLPRYSASVFLNGNDEYLHRLYYKEFVDATMDPDDIVRPVDGDFLNFCVVTIREDSQTTGGIRKGDHPLFESVEINMQNLQVIYDEDAAEDFRKAMLPAITYEGDVLMTPPPVLPNQLTSWVTAGKNKVTKDVIERVGRGNVEFPEDQMSEEQQANLCNKPDKFDKPAMWQQRYETGDRHDQSTL